MLSGLAESGRTANFLAGTRHDHLPPWYVWCGLVSVACSTVLVLTGSSWTRIAASIVALGIAVVGWLAPPPR